MPFISHLRPQHKVQGPSPTLLAGNHFQLFPVSAKEQKQEKPVSFLFRLDSGSSAASECKKTNETSAKQPS